MRTINFLTDNISSKFIWYSLLFILSLSFGCNQSSNQKTETLAVEKPNIILFIGDDISQSDFGCYGHPNIKTPNIDKLAAVGIRFENAYLTTSSCSPTRTSLITGRYPHNTGGPELHMTKSPYLDSLSLFPEELKRAGYYTGQAGKWHFNGDPSRAFDQRYGGGKSGAKNWVRALQERDSTKPFFFWFASFDAHRTWDMKPDEGKNTLEDVTIPPYHFKGEKTRTDLLNYYNEVSRYDENIGKVVEELKNQGEYENTLIIIMADNGRPFPRDKTWLFDSGIKTPLVIHWPNKIKSSLVSKSLISTIDIPPAILEAAGLQVPVSFQGRSLLPVLENPEATIRDFVFAERNWHTQRYHERMVRNENFVYIKNSLPEYTGANMVHFMNGNGPAYHELKDYWENNSLGKNQLQVFMKPSPEERLYDVLKDPFQFENLVFNTEYTSRLKSMRKALNQWTKETGDTSPLFEQMTADRNNRETWEAVLPGGRPEGGEVPGETTQAWNINNSGPVIEADIKD